MRTLVLLLLIGSFTNAIARDTLSDAAIKKAIIKESIDSYSGPCACPYQTARNGSSCGKRSAYSRPGGYEPVCYDKDVTPEMIKEYRTKHKI